ncbi:SMP-30/gluconolactonase/LRE family protein [Faunimonas sp. B44]|uniref:SMP-30/gluconolactonase/LRE family protein n=1 Tax=Faunimonas sp. B44 TaxID=3461493 RepID=UPI00404451B9
MSELNHYPEPAAVLGEAPLWDSREGRIWWVDCDQKKLFSRGSAPDSETRTFSLPHHPGCYAFRERGGMIMAYRNQVALLDLETGETEPVETGADFSVERFNDGCCDRAGRFWAGTMHRKRTDRAGSLFRIDPDLSAHKMASDLIVSNGISFSPDDTVMYHHDSRAGLIFAYDFDCDRGTIARRRVFVDFNGRPGRPDGCTTDAEGNLWVAEIGAGRVVRFDPHGRQIGEIALPVTRPSSVMLGGEDLSTLFITTMREGLSAEEQAAQPLAGCLFYTRVDVPGLPEPRFAG